MAATDAERKAQVEKLLRIATEAELGDAAKTSAILKVVEQRRGQYYVQRVVLRRLEGSAKTEEYGDLYFRRWTAGEVEELIADPIYQRSVMLPEPGKPVQASREDAARLFELKCDFVARAAHPSSGITRDALIAAGHWAFVEYAFSVVARKSGLDTALVEDISDFFRDPPG